VLAVFCGILAVIACAASIYVYKNTPNIHAAIVRVDRVTLRADPKELYLLIFPAFMAVNFIVFTYQALRWIAVIAKAERRERYFRATFPLVRGIKMNLLYRIVCIGFGALQVVLLYGAIRRCVSLLDPACKIV